jgi:hypothetical protein
MSIPEDFPDIGKNRLNCIPVSRGQSDSRVLIHEKWGITMPEILTPVTGNLSGFQGRDPQNKIQVGRLRYGLRGLQSIFSYSEAQILAN